MTRNEQKIHDLCSTAAADINLCRVAYSVIENAPEKERPALLEAFIIAYQSTPTDCSLELPKFMSCEQKMQLIKQYGRQINQYMMKLQEMNLPECDFYGRLWEYISTNACLPTLEARVIGLFKCAIDENLPYYAINRSEALSMDQETYEAHIASIGEEKLRRMEYILNADFDQKTQQASLTLKMMESCGSFEERTVFLTRVFDCFQAKVLRERLKGIVARHLDEIGPNSLFDPDDDDDLLSDLDVGDLFDEDDWLDDLDIGNLFDDEDDDDPGEIVI